jgi:RP/EB family microtubule-associated protein
MTKIEQLGTGSIYCHLLDAAYPSKVPLHRVKWGAYLEIEFIYNFKILQNCF